VVTAVGPSVLPHVQIRRRVFGQNRPVISRRELVPEMRVSTRKIILNFIRYRPDPFHLPSHPIEWCPWTAARLGGSARRSLDLIPFRILLR
jgi:hypothetical protein